MGYNSTNDTVVSSLLFLGSMMMCIRAYPTATTIATKLDIHPSCGFVTRAFAFSRNGSRSSSTSNPGMPELPAEVVQYSQVPAAKGKHFTATTIPKGLLKEHSTKSGTWGLIRVTQGRLEYQINDALSAGAVRKFVLDPNLPGVIEPTILHQVKPLTEDVEFVVEFYRLPGTGPVHETREQ